MKFDTFRTVVQCIPGTYLAQDLSKRVTICICTTGSSIKVLFFVSTCIIETWDPCAFHFCQSPHDLSKLLVMLLAEPIDRHFDLIEGRFSTFFNRCEGLETLPGFLFQDVLKQFHDLFQEGQLKFDETAFEYQLSGWNLYGLMLINPNKPEIHYSLYYCDPVSEQDTTEFLKTLNISLRVE